MLNNLKNKAVFAGTALVLAPGYAMAQTATPSDAGGLADQFDPAKTISGVLGIGAKGLLIIVAIIGVTLVFRMIKKSAG